MKLPKTAALLMLAVALAVTDANAQQKCQLMRAAKLDMTMDPGGRISVPMTIGGKPISLLVDTGGYESALTRSTVDALDLTTKQAPEPIAQVYGGVIVDRFVFTHDDVLGGLKASELPFIVVPDGTGGLSQEEGGILAPDVLKNYDADFDFANGTLNFFSKDHCEGRVVYWTSTGYGKVPFEFDHDSHIEFTVLIDGKEVRALLDTGARESVADLARIETDFGLNEKSAGMSRLPDSTTKEAGYRYAFKTLTFDAVSVSNPDIALIPGDQSRVGMAVPTLILGMNILRHLHIYIAYGEKMLYVTDASAH
ncbi:MAG TPA: aspartyl protease family protein [Rhizomicrobium sp.]|nr:aspartyl protease family protein [Rhizomicrobium sp.]